MARRRELLWAFAALVGLATPAVAGSLGESRTDRLCFTTNPFQVYQFVLDVVGRDADTVALEGQVVSTAPAFTMPAYGSGRWRADGYLEFMLTAGASNPTFPVIQLWAGRLAPPTFESGLGSGVTVPLPPASFTFAQVPCPATFPDVP